MAGERQNQRAITLGITGASGALYARAVGQLLDADRRVARILLIVTEAGLRLLSTELGIAAADPKKLPSLIVGSPARKFEYLPNRDIGASVASGSAVPDAMIIAPCSAGALGAIAAGVANDLLTRAADVCLKERRPVVLCVRETPLNRIHIENMLRVHDAGAIVMPAAPGFYYQPASIEEMARQFACRALALAGLAQKEQVRWRGGPGKAERGG